MSSKITASVEAPEGLPEIKVILVCHPQNQAEFHAVVEACGGPCAFTYFFEDSGHAKLADGTTLILHAPDGQPFERPMAPSIANLQEASRR